jgi:integrase
VPELTVRCPTRQVRGGCRMSAELRVQIGDETYEWRGWRAWWMLRLIVVIVTIKTWLGHYDAATWRRTKQ